MNFRYWQYDSTDFVVFQSLLDVLILFTLQLRLGFFCRWNDVADRNPASLRLQDTRGYASHLLLE